VAPGGVREFSAAGAPVLATGANYTDATLAAQAKQLLAAATLAQRAAAGKAADATGQPRPQPQAGVSQSPGEAAAAGNGSLRDPAALRACLGALNAADQQVVAVDLARFNGRDSAVIVLRASGGEYDVWVVARDCRPGADGTLKYVSMGP
jgi:hypothetical protein